MPRRLVRMPLRFAVLFLCSLLVLPFVLTIPVTSQAIVGDRSTAPIVFDGTVLFEVRDLKDYSAESRAAQIHEGLEAALQKSEDSLVIVGVQKQLATLRLGGRHFAHGHRGRCGCRGKIPWSRPRCGRT